MTAERNWVNIMGQVVDCPCADIGHLQKQLAEKDAMIDWLAEMQNVSIYSNLPAKCPEGMKPPRCPTENCMECWRKAARKAIAEADNA